MKKIVLAFAVMLTLTNIAAPYVTNVVAKTRLPWNGLVDVSYEIVGSTNGLECVYGQLSATDRTRGKTYVASTFEKKIDLSEGKHTAIWNMAADNSFTSKDVVFNMSIRVPALYCVIDLSGGPNATSYPVSDLDDVPASGWTDEYKTTKIVLRKVLPGACVMGYRSTDYPGAEDYGIHESLITAPFYIGVFEVSQRQWELVMGTRPSNFSKNDFYASRPVERISYNMIRGKNKGAEWPLSSEVDDESFIGILRAKTGLDLDLPTESQWEYACRGGTQTALNSGKDLTAEGECPNMDEVGRYRYNGGGTSYSVACDISEATAKVGSYLANNLGLYDMHGNVGEWCLDWHDKYTGNVTNSLGATSGVYRVVRGGSWISWAYDCRSAYRTRLYPGIVDAEFGLRLAMKIGN